MTKFFLFIFLFLSVLFSGLIVPKDTLAADPNSGIRLRQVEDSGCLYEGGEFGDPNISTSKGRVLTIDCVPIMVFNAVFWLLFFSGVVALFLIILGGFKLMTSGGDPKGVEGARKTITWAIIGLIVVLLSFGIVKFISLITGLDCLTRFGLLGTCG